LGLSYIKIGKILGVDPKTIAKAISQNKRKSLPNGRQGG